MSTIHTHRPDLALSEVVETGIELCDRVGVSRAIAYLSSHGLPESLIARVLLHPEQRRNLGRLRSREDHLDEEGTRFKYKL